jgi:hypothetical protein
MAGMPEPLASPGGGADRDCHGSKAIFCFCVSRGLEETGA